MPKIVDADENRHMIARAACEAIAAKGLGAVTMRDIASAAGVTTGMITNYFDGKQAIIAAALRVSFENVEARIAARLRQGEDDLADLLDPAIPATRAYAADVAVWINFWGLIATNAEFRKLNTKLHAEGNALYARAMRAAWPEAEDWPADVFESALRSIATFLFGLSAGGITNPRTWTPLVQRDQLRRHLALVRDWARAQPSRAEQA